MNRHPYLRAYMAGIFVPTLVVLVGVTVFTIARYEYHFSVPVERLMIFPMAIVPNLWGLWNMLFVASHPRTHLSIGFHGALLPAAAATARREIRWKDAYAGARRQTACSTSPTNSER